MVPAAPIEASRRGRCYRRHHRPFLWCADEAQPETDHRGGLSGNLRSNTRGWWRRCCFSRQLTGVSSDRESDCTSPRRKRHSHHCYGLREGHCGARGRTAVPVLRFSARQCYRQAERHRITGNDYGTCAPGSETAIGPRTTVQSPQVWTEDASWKLDFSNIEQLSEEEITRRKAKFDRNKQIAKERRERDINSAAAAE